MAPGGHTPWRGVVGGVSFRPNPLAPFPAREGGNFSEVIGSAYDWDPKRWRTLSKRGWAMGGLGGEAPMAGGCGGCPPTKPKEGASSPH